jgi:hypothetical protein
MAEVILSLVSLSLIALNLFQLIYWSRQTHKLIDKIMSRNYAEYVQTQQTLAAPLPKQQDTTEQVLDSDLDTLNRTLAGFN